MEFVDIGHFIIFMEFVDIGHYIIFMEFVDIGHYRIFMEFMDIGHYRIFMEFVDRCYLIGLIVIVNVTYNLKEPSYSSDKKSNAKKNKISS